MPRRLALNKVLTPENPALFSGIFLLNRRTGAAGFGGSPTTGSVSFWQPVGVKTGVQRQNDELGFLNVGVQ
jgi:hypothetical protein